MKKLLSAALAVIMTVSMCIYVTASNPLYDIISNKEGYSIEQVIVGIKPEYSAPENGYDVNDFDKALFSSAEVLMNTDEGDIIVLKLKYPSVDNINKALEILNDNEMVKYAEKDMIIHLSPMYHSGDADLDGKVTPADARIILRIATGLDDISEAKIWQIVDMDNDGALTVGDARAVMRIAVGLDEGSMVEFG